MRLRDSVSEARLLLDTSRLWRNLDESEHEWNVADVAVGVEIHLRSGEIPLFQLESRRPRSNSTPGEIFPLSAIPGDL